MDASPLQTRGPAQRWTATEVEAANRRRAVWLCRRLSLFAALLALGYAHGGHALTSVAFAALGVGLAAVLVCIYPGDRERVASLAIFTASLAITDVLLRLIGLS
jgi:hypothetical protein